MNLSLRRLVGLSTAITAVAWPGSILPVRDSNGSVADLVIIARPARPDPRATPAAVIVANDHRKSAGVLRNGVLTVQIDARTGE